MRLIILLITLFISLSPLSSFAEETPTQNAKSSPSTEAASLACPNQNCQVPATGKPPADTKPSPELFCKETKFNGLSDDDLKELQEKNCIRAADGTLVPKTKGTK